MNGFEGTSISSALNKTEQRQNAHPKQNPLPSLMDSELERQEGTERNQGADSYEFPTRINTDDLDVPAFLRKRNQN